MKIVDQMSYMVEVKRNLFYKFRNEELYVVLSDLMSVFNEGYSHGKTDEIIIDELGTPEDFSDEVCCYEKKNCGESQKSVILSGKYANVVLLRFMYIHIQSCGTLFDIIDNAKNHMGVVWWQFTIGV